MMVVDTLHRFLFTADIDSTLLVKNNYFAFGIVLVYIFFVKYLGPAVMRKRKPMDLQYAIILFNSVVVASNLYLCVIISQVAQRYLYNRCNLKYNSDFIDDNKKMGYISYQVLLLKIAELFDTVFFVLRKKFNQISFLHVFHHSLVVAVFWLVLKLNHIGYYLVLMGAINCGVHVVMYLYYCLSAIGPSMRKYLWWKKYLTVLQIMQFFAIIFYMAFSFITDCEEFGMFEKFIFVLVTVICLLFFNFYFKAYNTKNIFSKEK